MGSAMSPGVGGNGFSMQMWSIRTSFTKLYPLPYPKTSGAEPGRSLPAAREQSPSAEFTTALLTFADEKLQAL